MFGKVKKWLGIEGVKLEIILPEEINKHNKLVEGQLRFQSLNPQIVTSIKMVLIERYSRGSGKDKLIDEYELGAIEMEETFEVPEDEIIEIDFSLPFDFLKSDVDEMGDHNFVFKGFANLAKMIRRVKSEYRIEAEAKVKGVALNPFDKKIIKFK